MSQVHAPGPSARLDVSVDDGLSEAWADVVGPLMAGARARGVADALDLVGLAAVLIDSTGSVLHASGRAVRAISPLVEIVEDHLVGRDPATNDALQDLIAGALELGGTRKTARFCDAEGRVRLFVRALDFPVGLSEQPQLLRSVLIVNEIDL